MAFAPALAIPLAIAGIGLNVFGALQQGQSQKAAYDYQAQVAKRNAEVNELNARTALDRGRQAQLQVEEQNRALYGAQVAAQSASGLRIGGRSQILTRKSARELGRRDALNAQYAGEVEAYNYRVAASDAASSAQFLTASGQSSQLASFLNAGRAVIGGLSSSAFAVPGTPNLSVGDRYQPRYLGAV